MFKISFKRWFETNFGKEKPELTWALVILSAFKFQFSNLILQTAILKNRLYSSLFYRYIGFAILSTDGFNISALFV